MIRRFSYRALTQDGKELVDTVEADSASGAIEILKRSGLAPFSIVEADTEDKSWWNRDILASSGVSANERVIIARELATYINAGVPLIEALSAIKDTFGQKPVAQLFGDVIRDIEQGEKLSATFERRSIFDKKHISAIEASEASGKLGLVFEQLANFLEISKSRKSELTSALFYPIILLVMAFGAILFISTSLLPSLSPIFEDSGKPLPFTAGILLGWGTFLTEYWYVACAIVIAAVLLTILFWKSTGLKPWRDGALLKLPIVGGLIRDIETAELNRTLGLMLNNDVALVDALRVSETSLGNYHLKQATLSIIQQIQDGDDFSTAYAASDLFTPISVRMISLGDKSGTLAKMIEKTGRIIDEQVKRQIDRSIALLTPVLTLITGIIIGAVVISVLSAILNVNDLVF